MKTITLSLFGIILLFLSSCFAPKHKMNFDAERRLISSCDTTRLLGICVSVTGESDTYEIIATQRGSFSISLNHKNEAYNQSFDSLILEPNAAYAITSLQLNNPALIEFYTNAKGEIDSVYNHTPCE